MRVLLALAACALLAPLAAGQASGEFDERTMSLDPGNVHHPLPVQLATGDAVVYAWEVRDPPGAILYFSTHIHVTSTLLVNLTEDNATSKSGKLVADRGGQYSVLWENKGNTPVSFHLAYHTERGKAANAPLPFWLLLAAPLTAVAFRRR